jgi:hypothetical protein
MRFTIGILDINIQKYLNYRVYDGLIKAETCREYRSYLIKYFINCCATEGIIIYN